jgi:ATP-dependent Clp protease ATP-binding subunit ClpA
MDLNRYTQKAQEGILAAQSLAQEYNHSQIEPVHVLLALLRQSDGVAPQIAQRVGASPGLLIGDLEAELNRRPKAYGATAQVGLSRALSDVAAGASAAGANAVEELCRRDAEPLWSERDNHSASSHPDSWQPAGHQPNPGDNLSGPGEVRT